ncbi:MAG TPA: EF-P lysine aminoacylase EpmA, partial [Gammaproteobacteria bacterium]|nr:EF-P lysine aminoacylase EpmA [Gammaproteobacteria bacterium]
AAMIAAARRFFDERGVVEVDTPALSAAAASDLHIASLQTRVWIDRATPFYLQSSPESAMKRLLAAGSGPIFQFARVFRDGEAGPRHNPEFLLLEWYRPGAGVAALMDEVAALVAKLLGSEALVERLSYREAFMKHVGIDPFSATLEEIGDLCRRVGFNQALDDRNAGLDLLLARRIQPALGAGRVFVYDFPADQAAMARVRPGNPPLAERFELFVDGVEVANGYQELTDAREQRRRMEADGARRRETGLSPVPPDFRLLEALEHGLPECAGVALGFDRLVGLKAGVEDIRRVMAFPIDRA